MQTTINIIGAGQIGKTLGGLLVKHQLCQIQGIVNQRYDSALNAVDFMGAGKAFNNIEELPPADITMLLVPDDKIEACCIALSNSRQLKQGSVIMHCSGTLSSAILASAQSQGCLIASVHPMRSFADPALSVEQYEGTYCAIEGDLKAIKRLEPLFTQIGSIIFTLDAKNKAYYHAAGVFASNYVVTLAELAKQSMQKAGVAEDTAMNIIATLMASTLENLSQHQSPAQVLTGPIKRGDIQTVKHHLHTLSTTPHLKALYEQLGTATLNLATLPADIKHELLMALSDAN